MNLAAIVVPHWLVNFYHCTCMHNVVFRISICIYNEGYLRCQSNTLTLIPDSLSDIASEWTTLIKYIKQ